MTPVYAWDDALACKVLIGVSVFDGKALLPPRSEATPEHLRRPARSERKRQAAEHRGFRWHPPSPSHVKRRAA